MKKLTIFCNRGGGGIVMKIPMKQDEKVNNFFKGCTDSIKSVNSQERELLDHIKKTKQSTAKKVLK